VSYIIIQSGPNSLATVQRKKRKKKTTGRLCLSVTAAVRSTPVRDVDLNTRAFKTFEIIELIELIN